jgi:hypothetical protein
MLTFSHARVVVSPSPDVGPVDVCAYFAHTLRILLSYFAHSRHILLSYFAHSRHILLSTLHDGGRVTEHENWVACEAIGGGLQLRGTFAKVSSTLIPRDGLWFLWHVGRVVSVARWESGFCGTLGEWFLWHVGRTSRLEPTTPSNAPPLHLETAGQTPILLTHTPAHFDAGTSARLVPT